MQEIRCFNCNKLLFKADLNNSYHISIKCNRCKSINNFKKGSDNEMILINSHKVKDDLRIFYLDNNDIIILTEKEFDDEIYKHENYIVESVYNKRYVVIFDKKDDYEPLEFKPDILAFRLVG